MNAAVKSFHAARAVAAGSGGGATGAGGGWREHPAMRTAAAMAAATVMRPRGILRVMITSLSWVLGKCGLFEEGHVRIQLNQHFLCTRRDEGQEAGSRCRLAGRCAPHPDGIEACSPAHERLAHGLLPVRRR